jgi:site-specific recombinase XerD
LLFKFAKERLRKAPSALTLDELDAPFIGAFLTDLEMERGTSVTTRNLRLTAVRSFFRFVSFVASDNYLERSTTTILSG